MSADDGKRAEKIGTGPGGEVYLISNPSSVEVNRTAKGEITYSVKVYDADPEVAKQKAVQIIEDLKTTFAPKLPA